MSFSASDYIQKLAKVQHSDYVSTYSAMSEVLRQASIHPQSFTLSRQEFFDQPVSQMTSDGQRNTRAPLGARGNATCSMVQSCQVNWQITIPGEKLALQLNLVPPISTPFTTAGSARARVNFNGLANSQADWTRTMECGGAAEPTKQPLSENEHIKLWIGYSTACGPFQQIAICKDNTKLWETSIYAREYAVIAANSLSDQCTNNSVSVSPLETVVRGRRHCGIFVDIPTEDFEAGSFNFKINQPITIAGVLDLNQLNPIFNSFPVLARNFASLYLQLWTQDFLQDLKVVWLIKSDTIMNTHLAYQMIPPEKPDIIYLLNSAGSAYNAFSVRIVNMEGKDPDVKMPTNSISQINDARFTKLDINNVCFNMENEEAIIDMIRVQKILNFPTQIIRTQSSNFPFRGFSENGGTMQSIISYSNIKAMIITFAMNQYPTWMFPVLFYMFNLVIDQRNLISQEYVSLNPTVIGQVFECFVEQDLVQAPSDLYHSLNFQNQTINDSNGNYYGYLGASYVDRENIFYNTTLYTGRKAVKIYYPHKFMLAWKLATDDSFMRGYNSSKMGASTNIQVTLQGNLTTRIVDSTLIVDHRLDNQNNLVEFVATRAYPQPTNAQITPQMHYLCDAIIRFTFDDAPDPQVLNFEIIGEIGGTMVRSG
ncbi:MAG: hypothetical protein EZS28_015378 [Streblomastix strix]|uniref:Uncharacterized protein n=1 Tax=Streblomastix strix TaxID=222440 RepID=A0A5J4W283_9EUKA|nr:MAG: hypothetical protein EZS28_015378 [Streblomastix strix]